MPPEVKLKSRKGQHVYYVKGDSRISPKTALPSCTALAKYAGDPDIDGLLMWAAKIALATGVAEGFKETSAAAMGSGSNLHQQIEEHIATDSDPINATPLFKAWRSSFQKQDISWVSSEFPVYNSYLRYGGTADAVGKLNGKYTVFDWKTANQLTAWGQKRKSRPKPEHAAQVAGYVMALREMSKVDKTVPKPQQGVVVYLFRDTLEIEWKYVDLAKAMRTFHLCCKLYELSQLKGGLYV